MLFQPRKIKYKKLKKCFLRKQCIETKVNKLKFGTIGLKFLESTKISAAQLEMLRQIINRAINRKGKVWIRLFPMIPVSSKPTENRMGKGKGAIKYWVLPIKAGTVLFELQGLSVQEATLALTKVKRKLSNKTKIIFK